MARTATAVGAAGGVAAAALAFATADGSDAADDRDPQFSSWWNRAMTALSCGALAAYTKLVMNVLNSTHIEGGALFRSAVANRPRGQGLVTVSNHVSAVDDPAVLAAMLPWGFTSQPDRIRWTLCATDRCFRTPLLASFFKHVKVLPVERGRGVMQPAMAAVARKVDAGKWVHMFPEGTRSPTGRLQPLRAGVGRLVAEPRRAPLLLPLYHVGMERVLPKGCVTFWTGREGRGLTCICARV